MNASERVQQARTVYRMAEEIGPLLETLSANNCLAAELKEKLTDFQQAAEALARSQQQWARAWSEGGDYARELARGLRSAARAATWRLCGVAVLCGVLSALAVWGAQRWYAGQDEATQNRLAWGRYVEQRLQTMTPAEREEFNRLMKLEAPGNAKKDLGKRDESHPK